MGGLHRDVDIRGAAFGDSGPRFAEIRVVGGEPLAADRLMVMPVDEHRILLHGEPRYQKTLRPIMSDDEDS
ncbi:hypothetical protein AB0E01_33560 [Nocardia vinacea]|uniref:hypothetical protein n=1 Tax=Nocardia vinacea TaxID=96468 RepID=UPI0033C50C28